MTVKVTVLLYCGLHIGVLFQLLILFHTLQISTKNKVNKINNDFPPRKIINTGNYVRQILFTVECRLVDNY